MLAGASTVSIGTGNFIKPDLSIDVIEGIKKYMEDFNIEKLEEIVGKLELN